MLHHIKYTVVSEDTVHILCSTSFYSIIGISGKHVRTVLAKQSPSGTVKGDQQRKGSYVCTVSDESK
jgi:hypothetical protein